MHSPSPPVARRRRLAAALALLVVVAALVSLAGGDERGSATAEREREPGRLTFSDGAGRLFELPTEPYLAAGRLDRDRLSRAIRARLPQRAPVRRAGATLEVRYDVAATVLRAMRVGADGGRVDAAREVLSSRIEAPVMRQAQKNTCESAALSILLATKRVRVDQNQLQRELPRSGPLDPRGTGPDRVWGDPERGYVGRPDGGGTDGGFGVYQRPVAAVAARHGVRLADLSGRAPGDVYERLRAGRAVMVWVGLTDGPYGEWLSPGGRRVSVNFGEHTVVLNGLTEDGAIRVSNPLEGTAELWTRETFELMWDRLDRRALAT